jgi:hypothetical protein
MMKQFQVAPDAAKVKQILVNRNAEARARFDDKSLYEIGSMLKPTAVEFDHDEINGTTLWSLIITSEDNTEYWFALSGKISEKLTAGEVLAEEELLTLTGRIQHPYLRNANGTLKLDEANKPIVNPAVDTFSLGYPGIIQKKNAQNAFVEQPAHAVVQ